MIKQLKPWQKWQEKNSHYHKHPVSSELLEVWLMTINWREIFSISWWDYLNFPFPKGFMPDKNSSTIVMQCSSQNLTCTCTALIHLFQQGEKNGSRNHFRAILWNPCFSRATYWKKKNAEPLLLLVIEIKIVTVRCWRVRNLQARQVDHVLWHAHRPC